MTESELNDYLFQALQSGLLVCDTKFIQQHKFVMDQSRLVCAQTTVRAGKSTGLALKFFRAGHKYKNLMMPYIALTRGSAKDIMWPILHEVSERYAIPCDFTENDTTCTIRSTGSSIKLFGADMPNFIPRLKGIKTPIAAVDEAQDFRSHIEDLIETILIARTSEYEDGQVVLTGTPGPIPKGYFYEASTKQREGYSVHNWSLFDNPYFPGARKFVEDLIKLRQWKPDNPTLLREYYGRWVMDLDALLLKYDDKNNNYSSLPIANWTYILGIDLGFNDADALAVLAWSPTQPATYLVEESIQEKQGLTELVSKIIELNTKYKFTKMVIDEGGLGKKLAEEMRRQHKIPVHPADKTRKMEAIAFLNDALRTKRFFAKSNSRFAQDSYLVQIDKDKTTPDRIVVKDSFHSDIIDAALYAFRESPAYRYVKEIEPPKYGSKEWAKKQVDDMEEQAEEYFTQQEKIEKGLW